jgi:hypothetical protein
VLLVTIHPNSATLFVHSEEACACVSLPLRLSLSGSPVVSRGVVTPRRNPSALVTRAVATSPGGKSEEIIFSFDQEGGTKIKKKVVTKKAVVTNSIVTRKVVVEKNGSKVVEKNGSSHNGSASASGSTISYTYESENAGPGPVFTVFSILACVAAADAAFVSLGGLGMSSAPGVAALISTVATAATLFAAQVWLKIGGASTAGTVATCLTYAFGSVLSIVVVQAVKTSRECATAALAASAAVAAAAFLAKSISARLTAAGSDGSDTGAGDVLMAPSRNGMQGGPGGPGPGQKGSASFTRLEALREMILKEFAEETERLQSVEAERVVEMTRVEMSYKTRITSLEQEITTLNNKNAELSATAGKVAELEQIKIRMEADITALRRTYDAEIGALKAQVAGLEKTIADTEAKMKVERAALQAQLAAARGLYSAQKRLFDLEMGKYRAALDLSEQHSVWWKAEAARREQDLQQKVGALEQTHAAAMSSAVASKRALAQQALDKAIKSLRQTHDSEMEAAIAQALGERLALQTLMEERLADSVKQRKADVKAAARSAMAEAEVQVGLEWKRKLERLECTHKTTVTTINADYKKQLTAATASNDKVEATLRKEMTVLAKTHESNMKAAEAAHKKALAEAKKSADDALAAAKKEALATLAKQTKASAAELAVTIAALKSEEEAMVAELIAERDASVAAARAELKTARAERGQLYEHFTNEAAKTEGIVRARLTVELAEAEKNFTAFWQEKTEGLQKSHDDAVVEMEKNHKKEVASRRSTPRSTSTETTG